jgi:soluble lytic murein transglycosylase
VRGGLGSRRARLLAAGLVVVALLACGALAYRYYWVHRYDGMIVRTAPRYGLDPGLVRAVVYQESYFNAHAASGAGARGLMQVTDLVVTEWRQDRADRRLPPPLDRTVASRRDADDLLADPEINLHVGCWYLAKLLDRYRQEPDPVVVALAAYNAGSANADRWIAQRPRAAAGPARVSAFLDAIDFPETKKYVTDVTARYRESRPGTVTRPSG